MQRNRARGFTLVELLVMLAVLSIIALLGYPSIMQSIKRARLEGAVRQTASVVRAARLQAIKNGNAVGIYVDFGAKRIFSFRDVDESDTFNAGDVELFDYLLPPHTDFDAPAADPDGVIKGFTEDPSGGWFIFGSDGAASEVGAVRISDGRNYLEINLEPRATGRIELRKWDGSAWKIQGEGGVNWEYI